MKKIISIIGNKIILHGKEVQDDFLLHSTMANDQNEENDLEDIDSREDTDSEETLEDLDNVPMLKIKKPKIETWEINSSEGKLYEFAIQVGKLVESGIISLEERDKLIKCAEKIFID